MAYNNFGLRDVEEKLGIDHRFVKLFERPIEAITPSAYLTFDIDEGLAMPLSTEKAKTEFLIIPILRELRRKNEYAFTYFSGYSFDVDASKALNGRCDFLLSKKPATLIIKAPVISIVEAKDEDTVNEKYLGQCAAQMIAARIFNQKSADYKHIQTIYGAVSTGFDWTFLKLEGDKVYIDQIRYSLSNLPELLGVWQRVLDFYK